MSDRPASELRPPPTLVTVVVPVRNGAATIGEQLAALARQDYSGVWELVVADNGSTDRTRAVVDGWADKLPLVRVVDASGTPGPSHARNVGAAHASGDFLAFCDADDVVVDGWLSALVEAAADCDVVTGPQDDQALNDIAVQGWRSARTVGRLPRGRFLPYAPSCNVGVRAVVFEHIGGFREDYIASEDIEWSWRAQLGGFAIGWSDDACIKYRYRATTRSIARQAYNAGVSSAMLYRDFRARGLTRRPLRRALRQWAWIVVRVPTVAVATRRGLWVRRASEAAGRFVGSVRCRVLAL